VLLSLWHQIAWSELPAKICPQSRVGMHTRQRLIGSFIFLSDFFVTCPLVWPAIASVARYPVGSGNCTKIRNSCYCGYSDLRSAIGERGPTTFANSQKQMILLLGYIVSLAATFVLSAAVLSVLLAATITNKAMPNHLHRSNTAELSKHKPNELLSKLGAATVADKLQYCQEEACLNATAERPLPTQRSAALH
jgi:hypothetical protein